MNDLVKLIKETNSSEAYLSLKEKVEKSFFNLYHKKVKKSSASQYEKDDFLESIDQLLLQCIYSYNEEKGMSFNTYFFSMARFKALNLISKHKSVRAETVDFATCVGDFTINDLAKSWVESAADNSHILEKELELLSYVDRIKSSGILNSEINSLIFDCKMKGERNAEIIKELQGKFKFSQETAYKKVKQLNKTLKKYYD